MNDEAERLEKIIEEQDKFIEFLIVHLEKAEADKTRGLEILTLSDNFYPDEIKQIATRLEIDTLSNDLFLDVAMALILEQPEFNQTLGIDEKRAIWSDFGKQHDPSLNDVNALLKMAEAVSHHKPEWFDELSFLKNHNAESTLKSSISRGRAKLEKLRKQNRN